MSEDAKVCPFCGGKVRVTHGTIMAPFLFFQCQTDNCKAVVSFNNSTANHNPEKAMSNWNRRVET